MLHDSTFLWGAICKIKPESKWMSKSKGGSVSCSLLPILGWVAFGSSGGNRHLCQQWSSWAQCSLKAAKIVTLDEGGSQKQTTDSAAQTRDWTQLVTPVEACSVTRDGFQRWFTAPSMRTVTLGRTRHSWLQMKGNSGTTRSLQSFRSSQRWRKGPECSDILTCVHWLLGSSVCTCPCLHVSSCSVCFF